MDKKTKIVFVVEAMLGGIRQHVCDIVENLDIEQYDIYLIYSDLRADDRFYEEKVKLEKKAKLILCNDMQRSLGKNDLAAYKKLVKLFREIKPDIVHCHSSKAGIVGRMAAKKCRVPLIVYTPNAYAFQEPNISSMKKQIYIFAERFLSRYATDITINVSKGEMALAQKYHLDQKSKFTLIYNGIPQIELPDKSLLREEIGFNQDTYYVGVTARCAKQKDPFTFLKIAEKVVSARQNIEFVYIGDGELYDKMCQWIQERRLEDKIHMLGFRSDAARIVGALDLYLSTALYEGLPYSMIEAMRAGVPIIATDVVGNNELVIDGENGFLFKGRDINVGGRFVIRQIEEQLIVKENVIKTFVEKFSLNRMIEKTMGVYQIRE